MSYAQESHDVVFEDPVIEYFNATETQQIDAGNILGNGAGKLSIKYLNSGESDIRGAGTEQFAFQGTNTAPNFFVNTGGSITLTTTPDGNTGTDVVNVDYVNQNLPDGIIKALKLDARVKSIAADSISTANFTITDNGTLTAIANGAISVDSTALIVGDRILVDNRTNVEENGIYEVTDAGSGGSPFIIKRTGDADESDEWNNLVTVTITEGATQSDTGWYFRGPVAGFTLNTDTIPWTQYHFQTVPASSNPNEILFKSAVKYKGLSTDLANTTATFLSNVLTAGANGFLSVDGVSANGGDLNVGDRILINDRVAPSQNGVYVATDVGSAGTPFILTRSNDANDDGEFAGYTTVTVTKGETFAATRWYFEGTSGFTLNTTALNFTQFSAAIGKVANGDSVIRWKAGDADELNMSYSTTGVKTLTTNRPGDARLLYMRGTEEQFDLRSNGDVSMLKGKFTRIDIYNEIDGDSFTYSGGNGLKFFGQTTISYNTLVGTFTVGETITGGTSGATATIKTDDGALVLTYVNLTGTFAAAETITGGTSLATANTVTVVAETISSPGITVATVESSTGSTLFFSSITGTPIVAQTITGALSGATAVIATVGDSTANRILSRDGAPGSTFSINFADADYAFGEGNYQVRVTYGATLNDDNHSKSRASELNFTVKREDDSATDGLTILGGLNRRVTHRTGIQFNQFKLNVSVDNIDANNKNLNFTVTTNNSNINEFKLQAIVEITQLLKQ